MIITTPMILLGFHLGLALICFAYMQEDKLKFRKFNLSLLLLFMLNVFAAFILFMLILGGAI